MNDLMIDDHEADLPALASTPDEKAAEQTFLQWLRGLIWPSVTELRNRLGPHLQALDDAIAINPEAAVNYVLRGEIYLKVREYELAKLDFERACAIISDQLAQATWGVVAQALQDRAQRGLQMANKHLDHSRNGDPAI